MLEAIVAVYGDWGIGCCGTQPVVISADRKHFREVTAGAAVIVGRKTLADFPGGRPLPKRTNIVLTSADLAVEGTVVVHSVAEALEKAGEYARCFVIGGGRTYAEAIADADLLYVTHVHTLIPDADTRFPTIDPGIWQRVSLSEPYTDSGSGIRFEFAVYGRRSSPDRP